MTGSTLTAEQQSAYDRDGYFTVRNLFDREEIDLMPADQILRRLQGNFFTRR